MGKAPSDEVKEPEVEVDPSVHEASADSVDIIANGSASVDDEIRWLHNQTKEGGNESQELRGMLQADATLRRMFLNSALHPGCKRRMDYQTHLANQEHLEGEADTPAMFAAVHDAITEQILKFGESEGQESPRVQELIRLLDTKVMSVDDKTNFLAALTVVEASSDDSGERLSLTAESDPLDVTMSAIKLERPCTHDEGQACVKCTYGDWTGYQGKLSYERQCEDGRYYSFAYAGRKFDIFGLSSAKEELRVQSGAEPKLTADGTGIMLDCKARASEDDYWTDVQVTLSPAGDATTEDICALLKARSQEQPRAARSSSTRSTGSIFGA